MSSCLDEGGRAEKHECNSEEMLSMVREWTERHDSLAKLVKEQEDERKQMEKKLRKLRKRIKRLEDLTGF